MRVFCGILASGTGERFSNKQLPKQLETLGGSTVFSFTLKNAEESGQFDSIVIAVLEDLEVRFKESIDNELGLNAKKNIIITHGGNTRMESILRIIDKLKELYTIKDDDILCLSDASRPLIDKDLYASVIKEASIHSISCPSQSLVDGVGFVENGFLTAIPDKSKLQSIQTPEACNFNKLINLIDNGEHINKLGLCEIFLGAGIQPKVIEGNHRTYKVTYPHDIRVLEALIDYDSH